MVEGEYRQVAYLDITMKHAELIIALIKQIYCELRQASSIALFLALR